MVRVRMAPAPTGELHIGTARTALFNFLFAKKERGNFVLRIEDTDKERSKPEFEKDIIDNLHWLGIEWDEFYRQSERMKKYSQYLEKLLKEGKAYYCFCSEEELEAKRQHQMSLGQAPRYDGQCAKLSAEEVKKNLAEGKPSVIRFRVPFKKVRFNDLVRGRIEFDSSLIGDFVIAKNLAGPLYNFAAAVDDFEMRISHVIRGEDHISNTPKQILLQEALEFSHPKYAHLPLILGPDRSKLSKRHGAVALSHYRKEGYLPETLVNFMSLLGWNPGTEREIFSMNDLIKEFSLSKIQKGGAVFNIERLDYLNGYYIRQKPLTELTELCLPYLPKVDFDYLKKIVAIYQERLKKLSEIKELTDFFFKDVLEYNKDLLKWKEMSDDELKVSLDKLEELLSGIDAEDWNKENLEKILMPEAEAMGFEAQQAGYGVKDRGYLLWPFRVALTGKEASADPFEIAEILGKEKTLKRIQEAKCKK